MQNFLTRLQIYKNEHTLYSISIRREPVKKKQKNREATISTIDFFHRRSKDVDTENIYCKQILTFMDS